MIRTPLLALALLALSTSAAAIPPRMPPTDSCARDHSFAVFRAALVAAIARHDAAYVLGITDDNIEYSFGGDPPGRAAFARAWGLAHPETSPLWRELGAALRLGCARDEGNDFWAPSMSLVGDEDMGVDYFDYMVAVGPGAALRAGPSESSRLIARLRWDVVAIERDAQEARWIHATLADGRRGFVRRALMRGFGDPRAVFTKRDGRWRMAAFVAGD